MGHQGARQGGGLITNIVIFITIYNKNGLLVWKK